MAGRNTSEEYLEKVVERALVNRIETMGGLCLKFLPSFLSGFPDRICLLPRGRVYFVELKKPGEKPRKLQLYWHEKLKQLGFSVLVIDNTDKVKEYDF